MLNSLLLSKCFSIFIKESTSTLPRYVQKTLMAKINSLYKFSSNFKFPHQSTSLSICFRRNLPLRMHRVLVLGGR